MEIDKPPATPETPGGRGPVAQASPPNSASPTPSQPRSEVDSTTATAGTTEPRTEVATEPTPVSKRKRKRIRKRTRSHRRRSNKPYQKLTYAEIDAREAERAEKRRAAQMSSGRAMAPYNTTQFIMEDLEARNGEPDVAGLVEKWKERGGSRERTYSGTGSFEDSNDNEGEAGGSFSSEEEFDDLDAEFNAQYSAASMERLQAMEKQELITNVLGLEAEVSRSEVETRELRQMVARLRQDNYALRKTLRENGLQEARPASAPPRPPPTFANPQPPPPPRPKPAQAASSAPMDPVP